jgi:hypothetical protein
MGPASLRLAEVVLLGGMVAVTSAADECRSVIGMDDTCDLELIPGSKVLQLKGLTKICGLFLASHVYTHKYDDFKEQIQSFCDVAGETACCPTASLGIISTSGEGPTCFPEPGQETKSCESGKPDVGGVYNSWVSRAWCSVIM